MHMSFLDSLGNLPGNHRHAYFCHCFQDRIKFERLGLYFSVVRPRSQQNVEPKQFYDLERMCASLKGGICG